MRYRRLGRTDLNVSVICLGTMTWGEQNTEAEARQQIDMALDAGINFFDAAEMYPVPPRAETYGRTEQCIGAWLAKGGRRERMVLATKALGPSPDFPYVRDGDPRLDRSNLEAALEASLRRLGTDYVDLYQLHWPDRNANRFGALNFKHDPDERAVPIAETLGALADMAQAGKVRHVGLSNETPWGVMQFLNLADQAGLPRVVSVQNPYSFLNRSFEVGLAEMAIREDVGLLAYSPLGMGVLSGKYLGGARPEGARLTVFKDKFPRYQRAQGTRAAQRYVKLARDHGLDPAAMALAFVASRPFVTSSIPGARTLEQLRTIIDSVDVTLSAEVLDGIEAIHQDIPNPCP